MLPLVALKKAFIDPEASMKNMTLHLNFLNHYDKAQTDADLKWTLQNAKDTTWGLQGYGCRNTTLPAGVFGMSREEARHIITMMLEYKGTRHGLTLPGSPGVFPPLQLKQMYSRKIIQAQNASLLTGYGIDVYGVLGAEKLGKSRNELTTQGEKRLFGPKSIELLFQTLREQAKGAQKDAMNAWTGRDSTSPLGDWLAAVRRQGDEIKGHLNGLKPS